METKTDFRCSNIKPLPYNIVMVKNNNIVTEKYIEFKTKEKIKKGFHKELFLFKKNYKDVFVEVANISEYEFFYKVKY
jgi:aminoglycoside phosphotransferase family enzyme